MFIAKNLYLLKNFHLCEYGPKFYKAFTTRQVETVKWQSSFVEAYSLAPGEDLIQLKIKYHEYFLFSRQFLGLSYPTSRKFSTVLSNQLYCGGSVWVDTILQEK